MKVCLILLISVILVGCGTSTGSLDCVSDVSAGSSYRLNFNSNGEIYEVVYLNKFNFASDELASEGLKNISDNYNNSYKTSFNEVTVYVSDSNVLTEVKYYIEMMSLDEVESYLNMYDTIKMSKSDYIKYATTIGVTCK